MNLLKSIFISNYMMAIMGAAGFAGWMLYRVENLIARSSVLLTVAPILIVSIKTLSNYANHLTHPEPNKELLGML